MSVDLDVIPTIGTLPTWQAVITHWMENFVQPASPILTKEIKIRLLPSRSLVAFEERLQSEGLYYFELTVNVSLLLSVSSGFEELTEEEFLDSYAPNLNVSEKKELAQRWKLAGHRYGIHSYPGRSIAEPELMIALASALAQVVSGYVVLPGESSDTFNLEMGVYSAEAFREAQWIAPLFAFTSSGERRIR